MPSADEHQKQAEYHLAFLQTIDTDEFCDWAAVAAFYVAVHLVEKLRAFANQHSKNHEDRLTSTRAEHPAIYSYFWRLYILSRLARYQIGPHLWLTPEEVTGLLDEIQRYVRDYSPPQ